MISVIVPVYNVESYLSDCVDSILRQTYKDIEIILVDDGSTDGSGKICDNYSLIDSRVRVFHKKNGGLSDARNYGIKKATGSEITLIDSDDVISDDMIEILYSIKTRYNAQLSVCFRQKISETGDFIQEEVNLPDELYCSTTTEESFKIYFESKGGGLVAWGKLYDRCLFDDIEYPVGKYNEDVFTTYKIIAKCNRIAITSKRLYLYRIRSGSIMNRPFEKKHLDGIYGNLEMTTYIESNYPKLSIYPQKLLLYATLQTAIKLMKSGYIDKEGISLIRSVLFKYKNALFSNKVSFKARLFASILMFSSNATLKLISIIANKTIKY